MLKLLRWLLSSEGKRDGCAAAQVRVGLLFRFKQGVSFPRHLTGGRGDATLLKKFETESIQSHCMTPYFPV